VTHERSFPWGNITASLGYADVGTTGSTVVEDGVRGYVEWRREFH